MEERNMLGEKSKEYIWQRAIYQHLENQESLSFQILKVQQNTSVSIAYNIRQNLLACFFVMTTVIFVIAT